MIIDTLSDWEKSTDMLALAWAERHPGARTIVTEDLGVIWRNKAADDFLQCRRELEIRDGVLMSSARARQPELAAFVRGCGGDVSFWTLPCDDGDGHILLRGLELGDGEGVRRFFGIQISHSGSAYKVHYANLDTVFGLTRSEHLVLLQLLDGYTADEAARKLHVKVDTTRSHIRSIYAKLNVTSREGLFRRVRPYSV